MEQVLCTWQRIMTAAAHVAELAFEVCNAGRCIVTWQVPEEPGDVQRELGIAKEASLQIRLKVGVC